jgi:acetyl esterase/lipase
MGGGSAGGHISAALSHMLVSNPQAPKDFALKLLLLVIVSPWRGDATLEPELIRL